MLLTHGERIWNVIKKTGFESEEARMMEMLELLCLVAKNKKSKDNCRIAEIHQILIREPFGTEEHHEMVREMVKKTPDWFRQTVNEFIEAMGRGDIKDSWQFIAKKFDAMGLSENKTRAIGICKYRGFGGMDGDKMMLVATSLLIANMPEEEIKVEMGEFTEDDDRLPWYYIDGHVYVGKMALAALLKQVDEKDKEFMFDIWFMCQGNLCNGFSRDLIFSQMDDIVMKAFGYPGGMEEARKIWTEKYIKKARDLIIWACKKQSISGVNGEVW